MIALVLKHLAVKVLQHK